MSLNPLYAQRHALEAAFTSVSHRVPQRFPARCGIAATSIGTNAVGASLSAQLAQLDVLLGKVALAMEMGPHSLSLYWSKVPGATAYRVTRIGKKPVTIPADERSYVFVEDGLRGFFSLTNARIEPIDVSVTALRDGRELSTVSGVVPCLQSASLQPGDLDRITLELPMGVASAIAARGSSTFCESAWPPRITPCPQSRSTIKPSRS